MSDIISIIDFEGNAILGERIHRIKGSLCINECCELIIDSARFPEITYKDLFDLVTEGGKEGTPINYFKVEGKLADGRAFSTDRAWLSSVSTNPDQDIGLKFGYLRVASPLEEKKPSFLKLYLRGFKCFYGVETETSEFIIDVAGTKDETEDFQKKLTGLIQIRPMKKDDSSLPYDDARQLALFMKSVLSFSQFQHLSSPLINYVSDSTIIMEWFEQKASRDPELGPFHFLNLDPIIIAAAKSYETLKISLDEFHQLIGWLCSSTDYDEVRFGNGVTALEFFLAGKLPREAAFIMEDAKFKALAASIKRLIKDEEFCLSKDERAQLYSKIAGPNSDLNRVSLQEKIQRQFAEWGISLSGISSNQIAQMIRTRNTIVHTGNIPDDVDIWHQIFLLREILIRIILNVLNFSGQYESFFGGKHYRNFPSCE